MTVTVNAGPGDQTRHFNGPDVEYRQPAKHQPEPESSPPIRVSPLLGDGFISSAFSGITAEIQQAARAVTLDSSVHEINRLAKELNPVSEIQRMLKEFQPAHMIDDSISATVKELHSAPLRELRELMHSFRL